MKKYVGTILVILILSFFSNCYADKPPASFNAAYVQNQKVSSNETNEILNYIDSKLIEAGFSNDSREFVLSLSKERTSNVRGVSLQKKKELINRNIYALIENLHLKKQESSMLVSEQISNAYKHEKPWDYLLSTEQLNYFNSQSVFGSVSTSEMQKAVAGVCPIWPFCERKTSPDKGKGKDKGKGGSNDNN